jgi:hypothetical protein
MPHHTGNGCSSKHRHVINNRTVFGLSQNILCNDLNSFQKIILVTIASDDDMIAYTFNYSVMRTNKSPVNIFNGIILYN